MKPLSKEEERERWKKIDHLWKFNSCDEAEAFWERHWSQCPVCGEKIVLADPLTSSSYFVPVHKDPELLIN